MEMLFKALQDPIEIRGHFDGARLGCALIRPLKAVVLHLLMHLVQPLQGCSETIGSGRKPETEALHRQAWPPITPRQRPPEPQPLAALLKPQADPGTAQAAIELFEALGRQR